MSSVYFRLHRRAGRRARASVMEALHRLGFLCSPLYAHQHDPLPDFYRVEGHAADIHGAWEILSESRAVGFVTRSEEKLYEKFGGKPLP